MAPRDLRAAPAIQERFETAMSQRISIAVVGSGYVGLVATACFAEIGHHVICVDNDEAKLRTLESGGIPIHEEYLPELLSRHRGESIEFTSDLKAATRAAQAVFVAVGTPQSRTGSADLSYVDAVASEIARSIDDYKVIVEKKYGPCLHQRVGASRRRAQRRSARAV